MLHNGRYLITTFQMDKGDSFVVPWPEFSGARQIGEWIEIHFKGGGHMIVTCPWDRFTKEMNAAMAAMNRGNQ